MFNWIINSPQGAQIATSDDQYRIAVSYIGLKDTANAILHYEKAVEDTTQVDAMNELARVYMMQGQYDNAVKTFDRYIALNPKNAAAYYNAGITLMSMKRYTDAAQYFERGSAINPDFLMFYVNIGSCYASTQNYPEAIKAYDDAVAKIESAPDGKYTNEQKGDVYYYYGGNLLTSGRYSAAIAMFSKAMRYRREDAQGHIFYAQSVFFSFNREREDELRTKAADAEKHLRRALTLESKNTEAMFWLSQVLIQSRVTGEFEINKKKTEEAKSLLDNAIKLNPRDDKLRKARELL
jgi:tetratricopeptide (TPR) repeat protein